MSKIVNFDLSINRTCGECKDFSRCFFESSTILKEKTSKDFEFCKTIPACHKFKLDLGDD